MNILIINQPPFNRGDESAHKGLIRNLLIQIPSATIRVLIPIEASECFRQYRVDDDRVEYVYAPSSQCRFLGFRELGMQKGLTIFWKIHPTFRQYKRIYEWANVVVCAPGGICMGGFQDWNHLFYLKLAKFYNKPLAYYGRSFGPFPTETPRNRRFKELSLEMLNYFSFLSIRDKKTERLAQELNIPYISTVDTAFLDSPKVEIPYEIRRAIGDAPYMVFVPNYLIWHYAYRGKVCRETILSFYCRVMDEMWRVHPDCNIVMLPQLFCGREYELRDIDLFRDIACMKNDSRIIVTADCYSSDIQQRIIYGAELLVGARYHSIVFAINQNTPFVALSYEHKISGLLETLGKRDCCIDFTQSLLTMEGQDDTIEQLRTKLPFIKKDAKTQKRAKQIADGCMNRFVEYLNTL